MKLNLRKKISNILQRLKSKKKQEKGIVVVTTLEREEKSSDSSRKEKTSTLRSVTNKVPDYFIQFDRPLVIPRKRITRKNQRKIRGLKPQPHHEKKLWFNKSPIEPENN